MVDYIANHWLDITTTILGLLYILLEYRASIWLWIVGILMPAMDTVLYWKYGLYGDSALAIYYTLAAIYGLGVWWCCEESEGGFGGCRESEFGKTQNQNQNQTTQNSKLKTQNQNIAFMPKRYYLPVAAVFLVVWGITYWLLANYTNSTVPVLDGFTNALSIIGMWALARKFVEQWLFWIVVDVVCTYLYITKGIPFKAGLYGLYVIIAIAGYRKWKQLASS